MRELIDSLRSRRRVVEWTRHGRTEGAVTLLTSAAIPATPGEERPATARSVPAAPLPGPGPGGARPPAVLPPRPLIPGQSARRAHIP
ncbi:hypothetical protein ACFY7H_28515 [Streptomyces sp. NPDC012794]|uniref:hypothetical protein n=1 Tax=Streptomyces sp. NPDC012794 TaxID=3364850 RepID=UPI0036866F92